MKIRDPLSSPRFNVAFEDRALPEVNNGGTDPSPGLTISLGFAESTADSFKLIFECLNPRLRRRSHSLFILEHHIKSCLIGEKVLFMNSALVLKDCPRLVPQHSFLIQLTLEAGHLLETRCSLFVQLLPKLGSLLPKFGHLPKMDYLRRCN